MATFESMYEDEDSVTIVSRDENGTAYSETVSHNGSDWGRNNARDEAMERALNH